MGTIRNKPIYGAGINDGQRPTRLDKKLVREYILWVNMLRRCYDPAGHNSIPTYKDCTVSDNFLSYTYFYDWCQTQIGFGNKGWQLDKDILIKGNKAYTEDLCVFVPKEINTVLTLRKAQRGVYPIGVYFHEKKGKYRTHCCTGKGSSIDSGYFDTPEEAFLRYKLNKEQYIKTLAEKYKGQIDPRLYNALINWQIEITD